MGTRFYRVPTIYVLSKKIQNINFFLTKVSIFTAKIFVCMLHGQVFLMLFRNPEYGFSQNAAEI